jgi:hypothetical protein
MKTPTKPQQKMETLKHSPWKGMSIDTIGPIDKSVEGHHYGFVSRHAPDIDDDGEITDGSNFLIILGMRTNAIMTNLLGPPKRMTTNATNIKNIQYHPHYYNPIHTLREWKGWEWHWID